MKESLLKIQNRIKSLISFERINPHHHWNNLLYAFLTIIVILIIFSLYLLYKIKNQQIFQMPPESIEAPSLIDEKLYKRMIELFNNKSLIEKEAKEGMVLYKDPSLN